MSNSNNSGTRVLVTGASGYLATHCVQQLLLGGYSVRGTVRSLSNEQKVSPLRALLLDEKVKAAGGTLELVEADLEQEECWIKAVEGCDYVLHVASPFPIVAKEAIVQTAVQGTLNVLKACASKGSSSVKKVVLTSSCAAINEGHSDENRTFSESNWTNVESPKVLPYTKSKTEAERSAWHFVESLDPSTHHTFTLTCLNPSLIVGPSLTDTRCTSITIIRRFLNNEMPAVPALQLALVDVRDVAKAHLLSMHNSESDGQRILLTSQPSFWFLDIAKVLGKEFREQGYWLTRWQVPNWVLWTYSFFDSQAAQIIERLGRRVKLDNSKAQRIFGTEWKFTDPERSLVDMVYSMIERGILPKKAGYRGQPPSEE